MREKTKTSRLEQLKSLLDIVAEAIDAKPGARDLAGLAKQYREILKEISEIEGVEVDDELSDLLEKRSNDGKSKSVR